MLFQPCPCSSLPLLALFGPVPAVHQPLEPPHQVLENLLVLQQEPHGHPEVWLGGSPWCVGVKVDVDEPCLVLWPQSDIFCLSFCLLELSPMIFSPETAPKEVVSHRDALKKSHCTREAHLASFTYQSFFSVHNGPKADKSCSLNLWHGSVLCGKSVQRVDSLGRLPLAHFGWVCAEGNSHWPSASSDQWYRGWMGWLINSVKLFLKFQHLRGNAAWPLRDPANIQVTNVVLLSHIMLCLLNLKYEEDSFGRQANAQSHRNGLGKFQRMLLYVLSVRKSEILLKRVKLQRKSDSAHPKAWADCREMQPQIPRAHWNPPTGFDGARPR